MTSRRQPSPFNWATIVQIGAIPAITLAGSIIYQTTTTGDTLKRHDQMIAEEKTEREALRVNEDAKREELRRALIDNSSETRAAMAKLVDSEQDQAKISAVQAEQIKSIGAALERVVNGLENIERAVRSPDKRSMKATPFDWSASSDRELIPH